MRIHYLIDQVNVTMPPEILMPGQVWIHRREHGSLPRAVSSVSDKYSRSRCFKA